MCEYAVRGIRMRHYGRFRFQSVFHCYFITGVFFSLGLQKKDRSPREDVASRENKCAKSIRLLGVSRCACICARFMYGTHLYREPLIRVSFTLHLPVRVYTVDCETFISFSIRLRRLPHCSICRLFLVQQIFFHLLLKQDRSINKNRIEREGKKKKIICMYKYTYQSQ